MKEFKRHYSCRVADKDTLLVSFEDDGEDTIRVGCIQGRRKENFIYLNVDQIDNLIALLTQWRSEVPPNKGRLLWQDVS